MDGWLQTEKLCTFFCLWTRSVYASQTDRHHFCSHAILLCSFSIFHFGPVSFLHPPVGFTFGKITRLLWLVLEKCIGGWIASVQTGGPPPPSPLLVLRGGVLVWGRGRWWYAGGRKQRSGGDIKPHTQLEQVVLPPLWLPGNLETCKRCSESWIVCLVLSCFPGCGPILGENRKQMLTGRYPGDYPHNAGDFQQCTLITTIISVLQRHHQGAEF